MGPPKEATGGYSKLESVRDAALSNYKKMTGNDLLTHWLAAEFQRCDSVDAILDIIQDQAKEFDKFRDSNEKIMKWVGSLVQTLYKFSERVGKKQSAKAVFVGVGVLLIAAKDVRESHNELVELFERIESLFKRLGQISLTAKMAEVFMKIVIEVLSLLSIATKEVKHWQGRSNIFFRRKLGRTESTGIKNVLKRLDSLIQEAAKKATVP